MDNNIEVILDNVWLYVFRMDEASMEMYHGKITKERLHGVEIGSYAYFVSDDGVRNGWYVHGSEPGEVINDYVWFPERSDELAKKMYVDWMIQTAVYKEREVAAAMRNTEKWNLLIRKAAFGIDIYDMAVIDKFLNAGKEEKTNENDMQ